MRHFSVNAPFKYCCKVFADSLIFGSSLLIPDSADLIKLLAFDSGRPFIPDSAFHSLFKIIKIPNVSNNEFLMFGSGNLSIKDLKSFKHVAFKTNFDCDAVSVKFFTKSYPYRTERLHIIFLSSNV